jgi:transcriptional regulator with XRE-family HTH domain
MPDLKQTLRENTFWLLAAESPMKSNETGISRLVAKGIGQGTAQRILEGKTSIGLETLEQLSQVLGISPWRLIQPLNRGTSDQELSDQAEARKPSTASIEITRMLDELPAPERMAIKTILKKMIEGTKH